MKYAQYNKYFNTEAEMNSWIENNKNRIVLFIYEPNDRIKEYRVTYETTEINDFFPEDNYGNRGNFGKFGY